MFYSYVELRGQSEATTDRFLVELETAIRSPAALTAFSQNTRNAANELARKKQISSWIEQTYPDWGPGQRSRVIDLVVQNPNSSGAVSGYIHAFTRVHGSSPAALDGFLTEMVTAFSSEKSLAAFWKKLQGEAEAFDRRKQMSTWAANKIPEADEKVRGRLVDLLSQNPNDWSSFDSAIDQHMRVHGHGAAAIVRFLDELTEALKSRQAFGEFVVRVRDADHKMQQRKSVSDWLEGGRFSGLSPAQCARLLELVVRHYDRWSAVNSLMSLHMNTHGSGEASWEAILQALENAISDSKRFHELQTRVTADYTAAQNRERVANWIAQRYPSFTEAQKTRLLELIVAHLGNWSEIGLVLDQSRDVQGESEVAADRILQEIQRDLGSPATFRALVVRVNSEYIGDQAGRRASEWLKSRYPKASAGFSARIVQLAKEHGNNWGRVVGFVSDYFGLYGISADREAQIASDIENAFKSSAGLAALQGRVDRDKARYRGFLVWGSQLSTDHRDEIAQALMGFPDGQIKAIQAYLAGRRGDPRALASEVEKLLSRRLDSGSQSIPYFEWQIAGSGTDRKVVGCIEKDVFHPAKAGAVSIDQCLDTLVTYYDRSGDRACTQYSQEGAAIRQAEGAAAERECGGGTIAAELKPCLTTLENPYRFYHYTTREKIRSTLPPGMTFDDAVKNHHRLWSEHF